MGKVRIDHLVNIHIHSVRKRPTDSDGVSAKAVIDSLVKCKILRDDNPKYVKNISFSQELGFPEKTIMRITNADENRPK